jgi:hypothetical protein
MYSPGHGHVEVKESIALELCLLQSKVRRFMGQLHDNLEIRIKNISNNYMPTLFASSDSARIPPSRSPSHLSQGLDVVVASFHNLLSLGHKLTTSIESDTPWGVIVGARRV